jgi:hypothetical protein
MPTLSTFYGIKITMNYNDHPPPHFHAEYQEYEAIIEICSGRSYWQNTKTGVELDLGLDG